MKPFTPCGSAAAQGWISADDRCQWSSVDEKPFAFRHNLSGNPLFTIERLAALSGRVFQRDDYHRYFQRKDRTLLKHVLERRLRNDILDIAENGRWLSLHYVDEMDPEYERLFDELLGDLEEICGKPIRRQMAWGSMSVFLNGHGLKVPYHFDHETNFLLQIQGQKEVVLFPRATGTLSEEEIENFYRHNPMAGLYHEGLAATGVRFVLGPGTGVHHPPLAPHKISNGSEVSISLSVYYAMPETEYRARVYQVNYCLRKLGIRPSSPGEKVFLDSIKEKLIRALSVAHPRTHDEMLYSGIDRLAAPLRWARKIGGYA